MFSFGANAYGEFMGRWSEPLAERFVRLADLRDGDRALDVGCGRPFTLGVGPAGSYVAGLDDAAREAVRVRCAELLPAAPFTLTASAFAAVRPVPGSSSGRGTRLAGGR